MHAAFRVAVSCLCLIAVLASPRLATANDLVDKSIVTVPKSAGKFTLEKMTYDPAKPEQGVIAVYAFPGAPDGVRILLFAQLVGRPPVAKADPDESDYERKVRYEKTAELIANFELQQLKSKTTDLKVGPAREVFVARAPAKPAGPSPVPTRGLAHVTQFTVEGKAYTGLLAMFYRELFAVTLRAFVPGTAKEQVEAIPFADAMQSILPRVDIRNIGPCGKVEPGPGQSGGVYAMQDNISRAWDEGCTETEAGQATPLPDGERRTIVYPKTARR